jgi:hypothetical protein
MTGTRNVDNFSFVHAFKEATPSTSTSTWVSLKGYDHVTILISYKNATTVTGTAITLNQATAVAGTNSKALAFTTMFACVPDTTSSLVVQTAVSANTFTTDNTNSVNGFYVIEVDSFTLDQPNQFHAIQVAMATGTATTIGVWFLMGVSPRYAGGYDSLMNPLVD